MGKQKNLKNFVLKLGTSVLQRPEGSFDRELLSSHVKLCAKFWNDEACRFAIVSSGAIGLGRAQLKLPKSQVFNTSEKQACAALGQIHLLKNYQELFGASHIQVAQVLISPENFSKREEYLNLKSCIERLLSWNILPILNENDVVSTFEIEENEEKSFGDNDFLASLVASKLSFENLILLTNESGILGENKKTRAQLKASELDSIQDFGKSASGRGGILGKMNAVKMASYFGINTYVAHGKDPKVLEKIFNESHSEERSFIPGEKRSFRAKNAWIAFMSGYAAKVVVNKGAEEAILKNGASLLPVGCLRVQGSFDGGDVVAVLNEDGVEFARGVVKNSADFLENFLKNKNSLEKTTELIHRDEMVILSCP